MKKTEKRVWYNHKWTVVVFVVLRVLVVLTGVLSALRQDYESVFIAAVTFFLLLLPSIISRKLRIELPGTLEIILLVFIFASTILGEINKFYVRVPHWDTVLHTINGFCFAAIGFALVDMLNRHERVSLRLSPLFLAITAFCFSMTIGVLWEFFECAMDQFFRADMQKDFILRAFTSVTLDPDGAGNKVRVADITRTVIQTASGRDYVIEGGYLDVGLLDTMKDLFVNFIGAAVFSVIGYFYALRGDDRSKRRSIARDLMLTPKDDGQ